MSSSSSEEIQQHGHPIHDNTADESENTTVMAPIKPPVEPIKPARLSPNNAFSFGSRTNDPTFSAIRGKILRQTLTQPINMTRILMQIGYEPMAATSGKTIFGKETMFYPNALKYMKYVYQKEGFRGFYRGFGCSVMSTVLCFYTTSKVDELLTPIEQNSTNEQDKDSWNTCIEKTLREVSCQSWGILVSHPLQVMGTRCVAQFVGGEKIYSSINVFRNVHEIYQREGIAGFFVGLIPRWLFEISAVVLTNFLVQLLRKNLSSQKDLTGVVEIVAGFLVQSMTYPFGLTSTIVMINRSGLQAAILPSIPSSTDWQDIYKYLRQTQQLKRGSQFFGRVAVGYDRYSRS